MNPAKPGERPWRACLRLVSSFPLHLAAAFLAATLADLLLTMQPRFLRAFIDQAQASGAARGLWLFPAFMLAAAVLAYAYDFISVAIRYSLQRSLSQLFKEVYIDSASSERSETVSFALRSGLSDFSQLVLSMSLDLFLIVTRLLLILGFMALDQPALGLASLAVLGLSLALSYAATRRLSRVGKAVEIATQRVISLALAGGSQAKAGLERASGLQQAQFNLRSINVFLALIVFRLMPLSVLALYLSGWGVSLGALASTFLYFSMLQAPYQDMLRLMQESGVAFATSSLFRAQLEQGLELRRLFSRAPVGLVWRADGQRGGRPLSGLEQAAPAREYFDDMAPEAGAEKERRLAILARRSRKASVCLHSQDPLVRRFAHFMIQPDGNLATVLAGGGI